MNKPVLYFIKICLRAVLSLFTWVVAMLVILLSPVVLIRFFRINSARIAHVAIELEMYFCEKEQNQFEIGNKKRCIDIFFLDHRLKVCNSHLIEMWSRKIPRIISGRYAIFLDMVVQLFSGLNWCKRHLLPTSHIDRKNLFAKYAPHLSFSVNEEREAQHHLEQMGVTGEYVCFHARDPTYLKDVYRNVDMSYHDYRDSNIDNYRLATELLAERNLWSLRMGSIVEKPFVCNNPKVIDYATFYRSELMDIWLTAKCKFIMISTTGLYGIARIFNRPTVAVNILPLISYQFLNQNALFLPKLAILKDSDRLCTFKELVQVRPDVRTEPSINLLEATQEDIRDVALEMDLRLAGDWHENTEDEIMQREFWRIVESVGVYRPPGVRISTHFLRKYSHLL